MPSHHEPLRGDGRFAQSDCLDEFREKLLVPEEISVPHSAEKYVLHDVPLRRSGTSAESRVVVAVQVSDVMIPD